MLTDTQVRNAKPGERPRKLYDARGLYLHVMPHGGRWWCFNYRINGKSKTLSLGVYPDVSLAKTRARHQEAREQLADGIHELKRKTRMLTADLPSIARSNSGSSLIL